MSRATFEGYVEEIKSYLKCNSTKEQIEEFPFNYGWEYSPIEVDNNLIYFRDCYDSGLSPYKALLFFSDYLNNEWQITK